MDQSADSVPKSGIIGGQVCQICSDGVGTNADGVPFVACHICSFPVCRPCYEYERKDGTKSCPQCKTKYKRHKGSPAIVGEEVEDAVANNVASNSNQTSGTQGERYKKAERTLSWDTNYSRGSDITAPIYDKEVHLNHVPYLTNGSQVSGELSAASPARISMASPDSGIRGKDMDQIHHVEDINFGLAVGYYNEVLTFFFLQVILGWLIQLESSGHQGLAM